MYKRYVTSLIITAVTSAFLITAISAISAELNGELAYETVADFALSYFGPVWLMGSCAAAIWALLLGCIVELPKLKVLARLRFSGFWTSASISVIGAEWLLVSWTTAASVFAPALNIKNEVTTNLEFVITSFAVGGACSGVTWWKLVGRHVGQGIIKGERLA